MYILLILYLYTVVLNNNNKWVVGLQPGPGAIGPLSYFPVDK